MGGDLRLVFEPWGTDTPTPPPSDEWRAACRALWGWHKTPAHVPIGDVLKVEIVGEGETQITYRMNGTATIDGQRVADGPIGIQAVLTVDEMPPPEVVTMMTRAMSHRCPTRVVR